MPLREAALDCFVVGDVPHNPALWTMKWELLGSFLVAALLMIIQLPAPPALRAVLFLMAWLGAGSISIWLAGFPIGVLLAMAHRHGGEKVTIPSKAAIAMALTGLLLMSWDGGATSGLWAWTAGIAITTRIAIWMATQCVAACLLMATLLYCASARAHFSGRFGRLAGRASFPLYLVHVPILIAVLLRARDSGFLASTGLPGHLCLAAAVIALTVPAVICVAAFDRWWIKRLNGTMGHVMDTIWKDR